jgi:hypothetical protein
MAISRRVVLYLIGALVLVHNTEEAVAFTRVWALVRERVAEEAGIRLSATPEPMYAALIIATVAPAVIIAWAARQPDRPVRLWSALLIQTVMFLNAFAHVAAALFVFHGYAPGLLSAVLLNVPFSIFVYRKARQERWLPRMASWLLVPGALLVHGPLLFGVLLGGHVLVP